MKSFITFGMKVAVATMFLVLGAIPRSFAGEHELRVAPSLKDLDLQVESNQLEEARRAVLKENFSAAEMALLGQISTSSKFAPGSSLARRAAGICGWLQSANDYRRAERLAERVLRRLSTMEEDNRNDHVERLYWEAWLEGYVMDNKVRALVLLQAASELAPNDDRIAGDITRWSDALSAFGH